MNTTGLIFLLIGLLLVTAGYLILALLVPSSRPVQPFERTTQTLSRVIAKGIAYALLATGYGLGALTLIGSFIL